MVREHAPIAKITRPNVSGTLPRERLFRILDDDGRRSPVTWTTGPPGSGKTTLIAGYLDARNLPGLWYQVDERDADIASFFYYLGLAAQQAAPRFRRPLPLFTTEFLHGVVAFTHRYFEDLYQRLGSPYVLVFDNCQETPADSALHDILREGLSVLPEGNRAVLISRSDPPAAFARLRASDKINIIGWNEIKFDLSETEALIRNSAQTTPPEEVMKRLHERLDGWAAGLVLYLQSIRKETGAPQSLSRLRSEEIFDYFASEIFDKADDETRDFLLKTAFLTKMTPRTAEALAGNGRADDILSELHRSHFFTGKHATPEDGPLYQYHPLFREFLTSRAEKRYAPSELHAIQSASARLLEESGQIEDAADLYRKTGDHAGLVRLVLAHAQALISQGRHRTLLAWISWLPAEEVSANPYLLFWLSLCHLPFDPAKGGPLAEQAYERFRAENDITGMFMTCYPAVGAICYEQADYKQLDRWIEALEAIFREAKSFPSPEIEVRSTNSLFISLLLRKPHHRDIQKYLERYLELSRSLPDTNLRIQLEADASLYYLWTGDFVKAVEVIDTLLDLARRKDASIAPLPFVLLRTYEAMYHAFRGEHGSCRAAVEKGLEIARTSGVNIMESQLMTHAVAGALGAGDLGTAAQLLGELKVGIQRTQRVIVAYYHYMKAWHAILAQETDAAFRHIKEALELAEAIGFPFLEATVRVGAAQVQLQRGSFEEAREHLDKALGTGRAMNSRILEFMCLLTAAHGSLRAGKRRDGLVSLRQALAIGKDNGYSFFLFWHPPTIVSLCEEALDAGIEVAYVQDLIRRRKLAPSDTAAAPETWPWPLMIRTLGSFEVLREGKPLWFTGKIQQKPLALLKAIIVRGGRELGTDDLMYALWPDSEGDKAHKSCEITLHRLRKLLGEDRAIRLHDGKLTLDLKYCRVDAWSFEELIQEAEEQFRISDFGFQNVKSTSIHGSQKSAIHNPQSAIKLLEKTLSLYRGPFLPADAGQPWTVSYRESLRSKYIRLVLILGDRLEEAGQRERSVECYQKGLDVDCLAEEFYQRLMLCYDRLGQQKEARDTYQRCRSVLSASLGLAPSGRTEEIYRSVTSGGAVSR